MPSELYYTYVRDDFGNRKYGIKNIYGKQIIPNAFDKIEFKHNIFIVVLKDKFGNPKNGAFSITGDELIPPVCNSITFEESYFKYSITHRSRYRNQFYIPCVVDFDGSTANQTVIMFFVDRNSYIVDKVCLKHPQVSRNNYKGFSNIHQNLDVLCTNCFDTIFYYNEYLPMKMKWDSKRRKNQYGVLNNPIKNAFGEELLFDTIYNDDSHWVFVYTDENSRVKRLVLKRNFHFYDVLDFDNLDSQYTYEKHKQICKFIATNKLKKLGPFSTFHMDCDRDDSECYNEYIDTYLNNDFSFFYKWRDTTDFNPKEFVLYDNLCEELVKLDSVFVAILCHEYLYLRSYEWDLIYNLSEKKITLKAVSALRDSRIRSVFEDLKTNNTEENPQYYYLYGQDESDSRTRPFRLLNVNYSRDHDIYSIQKNNRIGPFAVLFFYYDNSEEQRNAFSPSMQTHFFRNGQLGFAVYDAKKGWLFKDKDDALLRQIPLLEFDIFTLNAFSHISSNLILLRKLIDNKNREGNIYNYAVADLSKKTKIYKLPDFFNEIHSQSLNYSNLIFYKEEPVMLTNIPSKTNLVPKGYRYSIDDYSQQKYNGANFLNQTSINLYFFKQKKIKTYNVFSDAVHKEFNRGKVNIEKNVLRTSKFAGIFSVVQIENNVFDFVLSDLDEQVLFKYRKTCVNARECKSGYQLLNHKNERLIDEEILPVECFLKTPHGYIIFGRLANPKEESAENYYFMEIYKGQRKTLKFYKNVVWLNGTHIAVFSADSEYNSKSKRLTNAKLIIGNYYFENANYHYDTTSGLSIIEQNGIQYWFKSWGDEPLYRKVL
jgi:hypothetical protein